MKYLLLLIVLIVLPVNISFAQDIEEFYSPQGKYRVSFKRLDHMLYKDGSPIGPDGVKVVLWEIEVFDKDDQAMLAAIKYTDVYGWRKDAVPDTAKEILDQFEWSPEEDFLILPIEGWSSAPGTVGRDVVAINTNLDWGDKRIVQLYVDEYFWIDDLRVLGDYHDECDHGVHIFDGNIGSTRLIKGGKSIPAEDGSGAYPTGISHEMISYKDGKVYIKQLYDNCFYYKKMEKRPLKSFEYDIETEEEEIIPCSESSVE